MSKFDCMVFSGGSDGDEFVIHAGKYPTKQAAIDCFQRELNDSHAPLYKVPTPGDVEHSIVRYYPKTPDWCGWDGDEGGCYTYCPKGTRGSFPVWVINVRRLILADTRNYWNAPGGRLKI